MGLKNFALLVIPTTPGRLVRAAWTAPCCEALHCLVWRIREPEAVPELIAKLQQASADPAVVHLLDIAPTFDASRPKALYVADDPCDTCARTLPESLQVLRDFSRTGSQRRR